MRTIERFIAEILIREGNGIYTDDPKDSGGPTRWGITEQVARANGYKGEMRELPKEFAERIYRYLYWEEPSFDRVYQIFPALAERLLDFGVLAGQATASKHLQRALNVLNRNGRDFPDLRQDGRLGISSLQALAAYVGKRGEDGRKVLLGMVAAQQSNYLVELAERRPKDEEYMFGWQLNRAIGAIL